MPRAVSVLSVAAAGLIVGCEAVCGCPPYVWRKSLYGRVESSVGTGIPSAIINHRLAADTACVFGESFGEIHANPQGRFRSELYSHFGPEVQCLELRAYDPASKADTVSTFIMVDFASRDSTGVVLRLP
jgi:hypothetical protein